MDHVRIWGWITVGLHKFHPIIGYIVGLGLYMPRYYPVLMTRICGNPAIEWDYPSKPTGCAYTNRVYVKEFKTGRVFHAFASVEYDESVKTWNIQTIAINDDYDDIRSACFEIPTDHEPTLEEMFEICHNVEIWTISPALAGLGFRDYVDVNGRRI